MAEPMVVDEAAAAVPLGSEINLDEQRRAHIAAEMAKTEAEFNNEKEAVYSAQSKRIQAEIESVAAGSHERYMAKLKDLEKKKTEKVWAAQQWRDFQQASITANYNFEVKQAEDDFALAAQQLRERLTGTLQEKLRRLEEEKSAVKLTDASEERHPTRQQPRRGYVATKDSAPKSANQFQRRRLNPPHIQYTLKENEVNDDWTAIMRAGPVLNHPSVPSSQTLPQGAPPIDVQIDHLSITIAGAVIEKGAVVVLTMENQERHLGVLSSIRANEIGVLALNGLKVRVAVDALRHGLSTMTAL